ncbi:MAG: Ferredoxin [Methanoregula sp. PtaU1.Bin051]|nr:MAG: Ferredoxin [Methanoregula sp. PtaU1.Bin051]
MKTVIYYFTGTGNTLAAARALATELGDTKLIPLRRAMYYGALAPKADAVGIAFPVHFLDMPVIVRQFVFNILFDGRPYVFGLATCGERPGGALYRLKELLEEKTYTLSAGFSLVMPGNYIGPVDLMGDARRRDEKYAAVQARIPEIASAIRAREILLPEGNNSGLLKIGGQISRKLATSMYNTPKRLHATEACNRCGICSRICPTRNITVSNDAVIFDGDCTQCYACIHWCPKEAIEIGGRTKGKRRYHHPDVTIKDMLEQRGE